ncbi:MAG: efflux RND transporter periplasmic adaptor subunit [Rubrivivax sp.]|nr:efflux RND transporter periplasmic adaptor subunit [Rubrivivax sp.]
MNKKITSLVAVLGLLVAGGLAWWVQKAPQGAAATSSAAVPSGPGAPRGPAGPGGSGAPGGPVAVEVGTVQRARLVDQTEAVGSLRSRQGVTLRPEVSGRIARFGFNEGQPVRRGQLLVQLDDTLQRAQLQQAEAQASIARTQLQRNRELVAQNFVSQSAVDQSAASLEVAAAQVALAQAQLARMRIVAPFDGQSGIRLVNLGDYVKDGADLVNLEDTSQVFVEYRLPERDLARVKPGLPVQVAVDALPGRTFEARIEALDAQVDADGRSLLVRARLDNREGVLRPGMFARARTVLAVRDDALVVPEEALVPMGGKQYLIKVVDGPTGKVSQRIEAKLGIRVPGRAEVLEGLKEGDTLVTAGQARLMRGDALPLRVIDLAAAGKAGPAPARPASGAASGSRPAA